MSDRRRWESKRRSPDRSSSSDYYHHNKGSSSSDRHRDSSYHRGSERNHENRHHDKDYKYDHQRGNNQSRKRNDVSDRDRYNDLRKDRSRSSSTSSYYSYDGRRSPPLPNSTSSSSKQFSSYHSQDNLLSSDYSSSPSILPPPPPPPPHQTQPTRINHNYLAQQQETSQKYVPKVDGNTKVTDPRCASLKNQKPETKDTRNYKLLIDPAIKKGHTKIIRYDGVLAGQAPITPKDPRRMKNRIWTLEVCDLPAPVFKLDKNFVGSMPRDTVRFSGLNDNVDRKFLYELCESYGDIKEHKVYFDPSTNKHTGNGKVVFDATTSTSNVVSALNGRSVMGNIVKAWVEIKDPPGHAILKQLQAECAEKLPSMHHASSRQSIVTPHQATPPTPNFSSLQRHHPVAGRPTHYQSPNHAFNSPVSSFVSSSDKAPPPPPPPLPISVFVNSQLLGTKPPPPPPLSSKGYDNLSPTIPARREVDAPLPTVRKGKPNTVNNSRSGSTRRDYPRRNYSPVSNSDQSISPKSPAGTKTSTANYEAISDSEPPPVEDISPVSLPTTANDEKDDDAMSLSSISSSEDHKVELNVQNVKMNTQQTPLVNNQNNLSAPLFPSCRQPGFPTSFPPPNMFPPAQNALNNIQPNLPQTFMPSGGYSGPSSQTHYPLLPSYQNQPPSLMANRVSGPPAPPPPMPLPPSSQQGMPNRPMQHTCPPYISDRNSDMLHNTLGGRHTNHVPMLQHQKYQNIPHASTIDQNLKSTEQSNGDIAANPSAFGEQSFVFQVKAGCARDISKELKRILSKDTLKKLVEQSAFNAFEDWFKRLKLEREPRPPEKTNGVINNNHNQNKLKPNVRNGTSVSNKDTTSALLHSLFAGEKNNESRPPSSFLASFRISRRPQARNSVTKNLGKMSSKRRPWPSLNEAKRKHQRIEDSDDDEDVMNYGDGKEDEEQQLEQFALQQRKTRRSGSSLYQKIYSDESDDDDRGDDAVPSDDDDDDDDDDKHTTVTESSSESSESSSEDESSSSTDSELESEIEQTLPTDKAKLSTSHNNDDGSIEKEATSSKERTITETSEAATPFRSMYDEPRRRAALESKDRIESSLRKAHYRDVSRSEQEHKATIRKSRAPKIVESETESSSETEDEETFSVASESDTDAAVNDEMTDDNTVIGGRVEKDDDTSESRTVEQSQNIKNTVEKHRTEDELVNDLIMMEHNYFLPPSTAPPEDNNSDGSASPSFSHKYETKKRDPTDSNNVLHEILTDNDRNKNIQPKLKRRRKDSIKSELKYKFQMRTKEQERDIIWDIYKDNLDVEDLRYMKEAFESLQQVASKDIALYRWSDLSLPPPHKVKRTKADSLRVHRTGSARSEGYYKIAMGDKAKYLRSTLRHLKNAVVKGKDDDGQPNQKTSANQAGAEHKIKSRENRAMQRRLASSFAQEEFASLINYNQHLKMRKKALRFAKSSIHNWGLFACEPIAAEEFVCEYVGQMVRSMVAELREQRYEKSGIGSSYLFRLDSESVIDATKAGCNARFINHSCQPNCYAKVILVENAKKIVIYSKREIPLGEEITYDYKFPIEDDKIPCLCGAPGCRGSLN